MAHAKASIGTTNYDPVMSVYGAQTGTEVQCNDDGAVANCRGTGTGADTSNYGSRISAALPRGISAVIVVFIVRMNTWLRLRLDRVMNV